MAIKVVLVERRDEWGGGRLTSPKDLLTARPVGGLGQTSFLIPGCLITAQFPVVLLTLHMECYAT